MPLPENFSSWEHLQTVLMMTYNRIVREEFRDVAGADWEGDISTPRASLRVACTIRDDDSAVMCQLRMMLFYITLRGASDLHPPLYTTPTELYQTIFKFHPQVSLYFREDLEDVEEGYKPIDAVISFRLMNETSQSLSPVNAQTLATKIYSIFGGRTPYRWRKGRVKLMYKDVDRGYDLKVHAYSETEGREVIAKVLGLQNHSIDLDYLNVSERATPPAIVPPTQYVYGESRRMPRTRPVGWVRFRYAELHIHGVDKAITLVDTTLRRANALIVG
jgi:hypothetical protein